MIVLIYFVMQGRKFNARKEDVDDMNYLGLRIYRFVLLLNLPYKDQGYQARNVNCCRVYSVYTLKPVLSGRYLQTRIDDQCSFSIRGGLRHLISLISYVKDGSHVSFCLVYSPETVHCSTKNAHTSEITFFTLIL